MVSAKLFTVFAASVVADNVTSNTPTCSVAVDDGQVVSLSDGKYKRCMSVITPSSNSGPMPVLFNFHGGGGSARNCGEGPESGELASLAAQGGFALICGEALQGIFGMGGQWNVPEVITDATGTPCGESDSYDIAYIEAAVNWLATQSDVYDTSRIFFTGCSMGSAFTGYISSCWKKAHPTDLSSFATHSTGLKVKNDGLELPPDNYHTQYTWGECPDCQYFPFKPETYSDDLGLKACIFDNTGDGDFYKTSVALNSTWAELGNRV
jgi:poly(3-hydroxybutyrate) depolymerase